MNHGVGLEAVPLEVAVGRLPVDLCQMPTDRLDVLELVLPESGGLRVEVVLVALGLPLGPGGLRGIANKAPSTSVLLHVLRDVELFHVGDVPLILVQHDHADLVVAVPIPAGAHGRQAAGLVKRDAVLVTAAQEVGLLPDFGDVVQQETGGAGLVGIALQRVILGPAVPERRRVVGVDADLDAELLPVILLGGIRDPPTPAAVPGGAGAFRQPRPGGPIRHAQRLGQAERQGTDVIVGGVPVVIHVHVFGEDVVARLAVITAVVPRHVVGIADDAAGVGLHRSVLRRCLGRPDLVGLLRRDRQRVNRRALVRQRTGIRCAIAQRDNGHNRDE